MLGWRSCAQARLSLRNRCRPSEGASNDARMTLTATSSPRSGREEFIFSCYNQDQDLDRVDFANLQARLRQNSVQEKIVNLWFEHLLDRAEAELTHV